MVDPIGTNTQDSQQDLQLAPGFREIPERHRNYFTPDCVIKTIRGSGGCAYAAVCHKLLHDQEQFSVFREACHKFMIRVWDKMNVSDFMTFPFKITVVGFQDVFIESEQQYLEFLNTPQSLTSFAESNIEMQNMSNILNVDIHVFTYSATACYSAVYKPMYEISQFSEWAFPTNDGLNTVVLYHEENIYFETIVSRSEAIVAVPKHSTLRKRKLSHVFEDLPDVFEKSFDEIELSVDKPVNDQNVPPLHPTNEE